MDPVPSIARNSCLLLAVKLSEESNVDISDQELFNYLLTGHNPSEKFTKTRLELCDSLLSITRRQIKQHVKPDEDLTDERIDEFSTKVVQRLTGVYVSEAVPVVQWDGATTLVDQACIIVTDKKYDPETVIWLHKTGYAVLLG